jgi:hypothetical protein
MRGQVDSVALRASFRGRSVSSADVPLFQALAALQRNDLVGWHVNVDEYVRGFPWSNGLWELRRVSQWATTRTPRPPEAARK